MAYKIYLCDTDDEDDDACDYTDIFNWFYYLYLVGDYINCECSKLVLGFNKWVGQLD